MQGAEEVGVRVQGMRERLEEIMRDASDPRMSKRYTIDTLVTVTIDGKSKDCLMNDIARSGAAILDRELGANNGNEFEVEIPRMGSVKGRVVALTEGSTHIRLDLDDDTFEALDKMITDRFGAI
ncbi:MAG: PilZ domain-containing protein [Alphaproteobacteria bacterium]|nr:PilZ domain-containing protein [Rhodospirillales bacterium]MCW9045406.1 PilZ domain-containing protein [Alphaproteobacteria bacterium]